MREVLSATVEEASRDGSLANLPGGVRRAMGGVEAPLLGEGGAAEYREGRFLAYLALPEVRGLVAAWGAGLVAGLRAYLATANEEEVARVHRVGVAALQLFVAVNWLGEKVEGEVGEVLGLPMSREQAEEVVGEGEGLVTTVQHPLLLALARAVLVDCRTSFTTEWTHRFWALRCCGVVAEVLEEKSDALHSVTAALVEEGVAGEGAPAPLHALYLLEVAAHHTRYFRVREADTLVEQAAALAGISLAETGALGKRTKFQVNDIAQFAIDLKLDTKQEEEQEEEVERAWLVRDVQYEDDVRLDRIAFQEAREEVGGRLGAVQQAVLMAVLAAKVRRLPVMDPLVSRHTLHSTTPTLHSTTPHPPIHHTLHS